MKSGAFVNFDPSMSAFDVPLDFPVVMTADDKQANLLSKVKNSIMTMTIKRTGKLQHLSIVSAGFLLPGSFGYGLFFWHHTDFAFLMLSVLALSVPNVFHSTDFCTVKIIRLDFDIFILSLLCKLVIL